MSLIIPQFIHIHALSIKMPYKVRGEYIWIDGFGGLRSKTRIVTNDSHHSCRGFPEFGTWNYDGSSTGQASTENSEVHLKPVVILPDPFRWDFERQSRGEDQELPSFIVLCETFKDVRCTVPHPSNTRALCRESVERYGEEHRPMFGFEQEFFMVDVRTHMPLEWDDSPPGVRYDLKETAKNRFYCGIGAGRVSGRRFLDTVTEKAMKIGLNITGMNYEVAPGQAEIQICEEGMRAADGLILLRYLLLRGGEEVGLAIDFKAKPIKGDWNGSGCHTNFSTTAMRAAGGYEAAILPAMKRLEAKHGEHITCYGSDNRERLTGTHETSSMDKFSWGVAHRGASVRIPTAVAEIDGCGYLEDRRPSSSMDPYLVVSRMIETVCGSD